MLSCVQQNQNLYTFFYHLSKSTKLNGIPYFDIFGFTFFLSPIYINKISCHFMFCHFPVHLFISYLYQQNLMAFRILTLSDSLFFYLLSISTKFHVITYFDIFMQFHILTSIGSLFISNLYLIIIRPMPDSRPDIGLIIPTTYVKG